MINNTKIHRINNICLGEMIDMRDSKSHAKSYLIFLSQVRH